MQNQGCWEWGSVLLAYEEACLQTIQLQSTNADKTGISWGLGLLDRFKGLRWLVCHWGQNRNYLDKLVQLVLVLICPCSLRSRCRWRLEESCFFQQLGRSFLSLLLVFLPFGDGWFELFFSCCFFFLRWLLRTDCLTRRYLFDFRLISLKVDGICVRLLLLGPLWMIVLDKRC